MTMSEFPRPVRLPGEPALPREPYAHRHGGAPPAVVDDDFDLFGAEAAASDLTNRIEQVQPSDARRAADGRMLLSPPFDVDRDRVAGPRQARSTLVVFATYGSPGSRPLANVLTQVRERGPTTIGVAWRHHPDPVAHPGAVMLALAAEAAGARGRFWPLTRELLRMRHHDPVDLHAALLRVGLDPERIIDAMRAGTGSDRIVADVASALASGVTYSPALFVNGERYEGDLDAAQVSAALEAS
jgi:hypothetical protein